jgi:hypothetical protein
VEEKIKKLIEELEVKERQLTEQVIYVRGGIMNLKRILEDHPEENKKRKKVG